MYYVYVFLCIYSCTPLSINNIFKNVAGHYFTEVQYDVVCKKEDFKLTDVTSIISFFDCLTL